ncbi:MAG: hypothetical protein E6R04_03330 [Spirochaetes bacterium]|nr:MAG: hypothetical protein E6R04_03330 [Spirochaetota bacterium]
MTDGSRRWNVGFHDRNTPFITNEQMQVIRPEGRLGTKILNAINARQARDRHPAVTSQARGRRVRIAKERGLSQ